MHQGFGQIWEFTGKWRSLKGEWAATGSSLLQASEQERLQNDYEGTTVCLRVLGHPPAISRSFELLGDPE